VGNSHEAGGAYVELRLHEEDDDDEIEELSGMR